MAENQWLFIQEILSASNNRCYFSLGLLLLKKKDNLKHSKQELKKKNYLVQIQFNAPKLFIYILE